MLWSALVARLLPKSPYVIPSLVQLPAEWSHGMVEMWSWRLTSLIDTAVANHEGREMHWKIVRCIHLSGTGWILMLSTIIPAHYEHVKNRIDFGSIVGSTISGSFGRFLILFDLYCHFQSFLLVFRFSSFSCSKVKFPCICELPLLCYSLAVCRLSRGSLGHCAVFMSVETYVGVFYLRNSSLFFLWGKYVTDSSIVDIIRSWVMVLRKLMSIALFLWVSTVVFPMSFFFGIAHDPENWCQSVSVKSVFINWFALERSPPLDSMTAGLNILLLRLHWSSQRFSLLSSPLLLLPTSDSSALLATIVAEWWL